MTLRIISLALLISATAVAEDFKEIGSIAELRDAMTQSGQRIRMKPGVYPVNDTLADNQTVFLASGSNNHFNLRGVTLQLDTKVLAGMKAKKAHELVTYRIYGDNLVFEGAVFEDVGNQPPKKSLPEFSVTGDNCTFKDCAFIIRGSAPYGYGSLFGKGTEKTYRGVLKKHSAISVHGDGTKILGCRFRIHTFGHAIHMHGAQDTLVENTTIEGDLRLTDEILAETSGPAFDLNFTDMWDRPITKGKMLALAEDGIRAYLDGEKDGKERRTGRITVKNCTVKRMRGSITLVLASKPTTVENCTAIESGWTGRGYALPSGSAVRNCRGDAAYAPLLILGNSNKKRADIELEVIDAHEYIGNHPLAIINGNSHKVVLTHAAGKPLGHDLKILCGAEYRASENDDNPIACKDLELVNHTVQPVLLSRFSSGCKVTSRAKVTDEGTNNTIKNK